MIDRSMDSLVDYLMKTRGEKQNPFMPPQQEQPQINPAIAQILQMAQGQQQSQAPMLASNLASLEGTAVDPEGGNVNFPNGVIRNEDIPNQDTTQPNRVDDPNYDWGRNKDGNIFWKPKDGKSKWIPFRGK